jgi:superfamily II DNA or RNA helicase
MADERDASLGVPPRRRPYQFACLDELRLRRDGERRRMPVSLPKGMGKAVVFARFPAFFGMDRRLLVLAHREEFLEQAVAKLREADPWRG